MADPARAVRSTVPGRKTGRRAESSEWRSTRKGAAGSVEEAPGGVVDEQCSRVEDVADVGEAPDPASGGGGAA